MLKLPYLVNFGGFALFEILLFKYSQCLDVLILRGHCKIVIGLLFGNWRGLQVFLLKSWLSKLTLCNYHDVLFTLRSVW